MEVESMKLLRIILNVDWLWRIVIWRMMGSIFVKFWISLLRLVFLWSVSFVWYCYFFYRLVLILLFVKLFCIILKEFWGLFEWLRKLVEYCGVSFKFVIVDIKFFKKLENKREREIGILVLECKVFNLYN